MVVSKTIKMRGNEYKKTYSDENKYVVRDGISYEEAIDAVDSEYEYTEGEPIKENA